MCGFDNSVIIIVFDNQFTCMLIKKSLILPCCI